tara:strand:- start:1709 stop:2185 length:477 start_codon:yes stop_codon:yes gene_type:complete
MPNKTGFVKLHKPFKATTRFELKWGEPAYAIAQREDLTTASIHMRVRNYGTPYQRRCEENLCESLTGRTQQELSDELKIHPVSVQQRITKYNNPYISYQGSHKTECNHKKFKTTDKLWLMEEHPDYPEWKAQKEQQDLELRAVAKKSNLVYKTRGVKK